MSVHPDRVKTAWIEGEDVRGSHMPLFVLSLSLFHFSF